MAEIKRYLIISEFSDALDVEMKVNHLIAVGWEPLGGVAVAPGRVMQAMVKRVEDDKAKEE